MGIAKDYGLKCPLCSAEEKWDRLYGDCYHCGYRTNGLNWKAKLRAWLIDIVREAIRIEDAEILLRNNFFQSRPTGSIPRLSPMSWREDIASKPVTSTPIPVQEKSFEQFQDESIAEQATYYAPKEI